MAEPIPGVIIGVIGDHFTGFHPPAGCEAYTGSAIAQKNAIERLRWLAEIEKMRRSGQTVFIMSHEAELLRRVADEFWWIENGVTRAKGEPAEILREYQRHVMRSLRQNGLQSLIPSMRRGDGRAEVLSIETLGPDGQPAFAWNSGDTAAVRVLVKFNAAVDDPVIGIMIRTRIGCEVYGTNTELERVKLGSCVPGDIREITFQFTCTLCAQEYTVTAASHDPDGVWHDWMEDAIAFTVIDTRYTAGVANLRAQVSVTGGNG